MDVAHRALDLPLGATVVATNAEEGSATSFRRVLDELLEAPDPELKSIGAAEALREMRAQDG
ncbi:MAG TPA: hypothetical protein VEJ84_24800 [Acidimicrobiales bacterium]|nr:hypothetical protein [Acidimicrobiales bacterium]